MTISVTKDDKCAAVRFDRFLVKVELTKAEQERLMAMHRGIPIEDALYLLLGECLDDALERRSR